MDKERERLRNCKSYIRIAVIEHQRDAKKSHGLPNLEAVFAQQREALLGIGQPAECIDQVIAELRQEIPPQTTIGYSGYVMCPWTGCGKQQKGALGPQKCQACNRPFEVVRLNYHVFE